MSKCGDASVTVTYIRYSMKSGYLGPVAMEPWTLEAKQYPAPGHDPDANTSIPLPTLGLRLRMSLAEASQ